MTIRTIHGIAAPVNRQPAVPSTPGAGAFGRTLEGAISRQGEVRLSGHAADRLRARNIVLGDGDMRRIGAAAARLEAKGGREALVVLEQVGLILDVRNRTVVTAIERAQLQENVFTNIDSAVFA